VKYEYLYVAEHSDVRQRTKGLSEYWRFYNGERPHQAVGNRTPVAERHTNQYAPGLEV